MKRFIKSKKGVAVLTTLVVLASAIGAYAYFTGGGSGTGTAQVGSADAVTISQIGAGYDSLRSSGIYHQDQCFNCAGVDELGNAVTLNGNNEQLVSVTVAFRNWDAAVTLPVTLSIDHSSIGAIHDTESFAFPAGDSVTGRPTEQDVTFDFSGQGAKLPSSFVYGISFNKSVGTGLNVALSNSNNDLSVGTDTDPGTIWVNANNTAVGNTFPVCSQPHVVVGTFTEVPTACGPSNPNEKGAYGDQVNAPGSTDADIPAVEFNVVGGELSSLTPNGPALPIEFAITNPGSGDVFVSTVTSTVSSISGAGSTPPSPGVDACTIGLFPISGSPAAINATVPSGGTSLFTSTGTSISMPDDGNNQDNCQHATVNLKFTSP